MGQLTAGERVLWRALRWRAPGWCREYATGRYRLDFYCPAARLAIEVDGQSHNGRQAWERDRQRDAWHAQRGILTKRYSGYEVLRETGRVRREVEELVRQRAPEMVGPGAQRRFAWLVLTGRRPVPVAPRAPRTGEPAPLVVRDERLTEGIRRLGRIPPRRAGG